MSRNPKYRRVLLKLSGQGLMGKKAYGFDSGTVERIATEICGVHGMGVQICLVIGGGNIFRGGAQPVPASNGRAPTTWACWPP